MLKLFYTTTKGQDIIQSRADKSLGGYRSASPVKNDDFGNLFGEISNYTLKHSDEANYIGLILLNDSTSPVTDVNVWFEYPIDCYSKLAIAAVDLSTDVDGNKFMENVPTITSSPVYGTFYEADGEANKQSIGNMTAGEMVGIWLKRIILSEVVDQDISNQIIIDPENSHRVKFVELSKSDTIEMKMSYT